MLLILSRITTLPESVDMVDLEGQTQRNEPSADAPVEIEDSGTREIQR